MSHDVAGGSDSGSANVDERPGFVSLLREPNMRRLWIAQAFSSAGESLAQIAMPLLVYELTGSARLVGLIALVLILPRVLLSPVTGLLVDRVNRRRLMILADSWRLILVIIVPFTTGMWPLALLAAGIAIGNAVARPAELATVPSVAGPHRLVSALSLVQVTSGVIRIAAPAAGAAVIAAIGPGPVFWVQALCYIGSLLALRRLVVPAVVRIDDRGRGLLQMAKAEMWAGVRAIVSMPIVRGVTASETLWSLVAGAMVVAGVVYTQETLDLGDRADAAFALMTTFMASGAVVGALLASRVERRIGRPALLMVGYLGPFFMCAGFFSPPMGVIYAAWFALGFTDAWAVISFQSYLAEAVPAELRGRVFAAWGAVVALGGALAFPLLGLITPWLGAPNTFGLVGLVVGIGGPFLLWSTGAIDSVRTHQAPVG
ncbi:MAG: MFS transporter [Chloroflexota bacterium]|nr:MFS transporter [Chloroflexota bacterium]